MREVNIFIIQRPIGNPVKVREVCKDFGENIPQLCPLEGGDYKGPQYICCVDKNVDFEAICEKYDYRYYPAFSFQVVEEKYNSEYQVLPNYFNKTEPYRLEKYVKPPYDDSD
jgi:hypothetical protein